MAEARLALLCASLLVASLLARELQVGRPTVFAEPAAPGVVARWLEGRRVHPQEVGVTDFTLLPGIGPALAAAIGEERGNGPFCSVRSLERVRGIGPARVRELRRWLTDEGGHPDCEFVPSTAHMAPSQRIE